MKVKVDSDTCRGCGFCIRMAQDVFEKDEVGKVRAVDGSVPGHLEEHVEAAAEMCPEGSIEVEGSTL